ncbi:MAG: hypothetical protein ACK5N8_07070 [Alphaproteobacteria bacterium]
MKIFVTAIFAVAMSLILSGCSTSSKIQKAAENFGTGEKNFFESYGLKTSGSYVAGRVVFAERKSIGDEYGTYVELDNGKKFTMLRNEDGTSPIVFLTEETKKLNRDAKNPFDAQTVKELYIEAIVENDISRNYVAYNYEGYKKASNFLKNGEKNKTGESSLDISNYKKRPEAGSAKTSGKSKIVESVLYLRGSKTFTCYYLEDGKVLTLSDASKQNFLDKGKKALSTGKEVSYVLSNMDGKRVERDPFTNVLDYVIE